VNFIIVFLGPIVGDILAFLIGNWVDGRFRPPARTIADDDIEATP